MANNSTINSVDEILKSMTQYVCFGSAAVVSNCFILFVLLRNFQYFKKSALIAGLAFGDLLDGSALLINGALRIAQALDGTSFLKVHPSYCMTIAVTPIFLLGNQIPGVMFLLIGVERFLAFQCYQWYYFSWTSGLAWKLTGAVYIYVAVSLSAAFVVVFNIDQNYRIPIGCATSTVIGQAYTAYNYGVAIVGGLMAVAGTVTAMVAFTVRKRSMFSLCSDDGQEMKSYVTKQWHLTRVSLSLAVIDLGLVVAPNILVTLVSSTNIVLKSWSLQLVCLRSVLNAIIYVVINSDFRSACLKAFKINIGKNSVIVPSKVFTHPTEEKSNTRKSITTSNL